MARYTLRIASDKRIDVLDSKFGRNVTAIVRYVENQEGKGWRVHPQNVGRRSSRTLHATPEKALASMRYMTEACARSRMSDARKEQIVPREPIRSERGKIGLSGCDLDPNYYGDHGDSW